MTKNETRRYIILAVILAVFSVIAFVAPFTRNGLFWVGYVFGVIAIVAQFYILKISFANGADIKSKFYGFPIAKVGAIWLCVQLVLSIVEMAVSEKFETWFGLILNVIIAGIAIIGTVAADTMRETVEQQDTVVKKNTSMMRELQTMSASLAGLCTDDELRKQILKLAEELRYSDPVSTEESEYSELQLKQGLIELRNMLKGSDIENAADKVVNILAILEERNRICKTSK